MALEQGEDGPRFSAWSLYVFYDDQVWHVLFPRSRQLRGQQRHPCSPARLPPCSSLLLLPEAGRSPEEAEQ